MAALRPVLLAAGGTGGHLFPAEALAAVLKARGLPVALATDERAVRYGGAFPPESIHVFPSATIRGRDPLSIAKTFGSLGIGFGRAFLKLPSIAPSIVVGFGGYPTLPPLMAATARKIPMLIHEQNAVMGRANRMLASRATAIATGFAGVFAQDAALRAKATHTGNPVRPAVLAAAVTPYAPPQPNGELRLVIFGGSQGAKVMSDVVPGALEKLSPHRLMRLRVVQQARGEDMERVRKIYARLGVSAEVEPFFPDMPARIANAHLVVSRAGASTVAELAAIGRPGILVPLPNALDQDQRANAGILQEAGGGIRIDQNEFTPARLAAEIEGLADDPGRLAAMAAAAKAVGAPDAAERLADLVLRVAGVLGAAR